MTTTSKAPASSSRPVAPGASDRVRLARLARAVALQVPGAMAADVGAAGLCVTRDGADRLDGVTCVATADGGYQVTLCLVCALVPLEPLAASVRFAVASAATAAGLPLHSVDVHIAALTVAGAG